ncbi:MAG: DEAD/DEAH box helicase [Nanoarchaeota archaeon]|nr:DEAD/DEAH box helicase [Nanoarchaeota archaeon]
MLNIKPRDYQKAIFETAKDKNTLVVLPTGIGKTLIALLLTIERLKKYPGSKILILAPTKPLVEQHFQSFKEQLPELFADLQLFTGAVPPKQRQKIWQTAEVIFSTPQCIANDLKNYLYDTKDVSLLVIDEAHRCIKNYDYTKVVSFYKQQTPPELQRILGLTASPGSEEDKVKQICKNLAIEEVEIRSRDSKDVKPYLQNLEFNKIEVPFPPEFMEIRELLKTIFNKKVEQLKSRKLLFGPANKITLLQLQGKLAARASQRNFNVLAGMSLCAQAIKISHAIELLETQTLSGLKEYLQGIVKQAEEKKSKGVQVLVKSEEFKKALLFLNRLLSKKIEHPKIEELKALIENQISTEKNPKIIVFTQFRETAQKIALNLNTLEKIKAKVFVGQTKKTSSLGTSGLNQKEQKKVIEEFREGKINIICATSIGEEGLDIPEVSAVYFYEPVPSAIRKIQRTGRTARLSPGKLFILITKGTRDQIYHYVSSARERKMYRTIHNIKEEIKNNNKIKTLDDFK